MYDIAIIGCGVTGAAAAYQFSRYKLRTVILEACNDVSCGTSKANSAIIHAGYDPEPDTLMAKLNVTGNRLTQDICKKLSVPFKRTGSLVVGFTDEDTDTLQELYRRGTINAVPDLRLLTGDQARELEPNLNGDVKAALYAPSAGIIDPWEFTLAMAETAVVNGTELYLNAPVTAIQKENGGFTITTPQRTFCAAYVFNAAGVHADCVHALLEEPDYRITASRGEYYLLDKSQGELVHRVVFQCPSKTSKGVLIAPTVHGNLIVGPNAQDVQDKDNTATTAAGLAFVSQKAALSVPSVNFRENIRNFAGIRANNTRGDFILEESKTAAGFFDLAGIKSPGLSCAPAIGLYAAELLKRSGAVLRQKTDFKDERKRIIFKELSIEEKQELIQKDPRYGQIVCRCETVTEGEIIAALRSPIPARSLNGIKRRCGAGMGRCQSGFCGPRVQALIAQEANIPLQSVPLEQDASFILTEKTKLAHKNGDTPCTN